MLKNIEKQTLTVNNKMELGEDISVEAKGKGRKFVSRFIEPGVAHYEEFGDVLITKETLDGFINTMVGCPVIIQHKDIDDKNADKERVGVISNVWFDQFDGWYYCDGIIWDKQAIDLIKNQDWSVSCTYDFDSDKLEKTHNGKKIDMEFTGGEFLHLALVPNPRYERANIVMNAEDDEFETNHPRDEFGKFVDKLNKAGFDAKLDDFNWGDTSLKDALGNPDRNPYVKDNKIYLFKKHKDDYKAAFHEYGHLLAKRNPELFEQYKKQNEDFSIDKYSKGYRNIAISNLEELFAEVFANYIEGEKDDEIKLLSSILEQYYFNKKQTQNSKGDLIMSVLNELESFVKGIIKNAEDEKAEKEAKNEDKRKLIDEVGGILKGKVDDEIIKTIMKKMEEASYEPSEDDKADNKCKNEDEEKEEKFEEEKEIANKKAKNEEEKEDKVEDEDDEKDEDDEVDKEEVKNKCKNAMKDVKEIIMGGKTQVKTNYISKAERFALGEKY